MKFTKQFHKSTADFVAISSEKLSANDFLVLKSTRPTEIKSVKFIAPRLGGKGFGSFVVDYRTPRLVAAE